jgi:oxalate---CoA ligase
MHFNFKKFGSISILNDDSYWTNTELELQAFIRVNELIGLGFKSGDKVVIAHGGTLNFFADLFAVWCLGGCACCLNENSTREEIIRIAKFVNSKFILVGASVDKKLILKGVNVISLKGVPNCNDNDIQKYIDISKIDLDALILFTSGTTGVPKGVTHTYRGLLSRLVLNWECIPYKDRVVGLCTLPTHFGHGLIGNCLTVLMGGGDLIISSGSELAINGNLGEVIDKHKVSFMSSVPSFWRGVLRSTSPIGESLRRVHIGSAPLSEQLWNDVITWTGIKNIVNMYGITETANWICGASAEEYNPESGLVGKPWGGEICVLDENNSFCSSGYGELIVQTPSIMREYFNLPLESSEAIKGGWFKTGDYGKIDKKGVVVITGRKKYQINKAGIKIHPEDIDILLEGNKEVLEACTFGIDDEISGQVVGVAISPNDNHSFDLKKLKKWVSKKIVKDKNPDFWFVLDSIPKTDRGKINRDNVASLCFSNAHVESAESTNSDPVVKILKEVLGVNIVDHHNLVASEIDEWDSLAMLRVMLALEKYIDREVSADELLLLDSYSGIKSILDKTYFKPKKVNDKNKRQELMSIVKKAGYGKHKINHMLISHSFCNKFGVKNIGLLMKDLIKELPDDSTLVMGGFTWDFIDSAEYTSDDSSTQLGIVNEQFRRIKGVKRSCHPIYSYLSIGPLTGELFKDQTSDCWGEGSVTLKLIKDYDTRVICLGLGLKDGEGLVAATGIHALEQQFKVPYRFFKIFKGDVNFGDGHIKYQAKMYVRDLNKSLRSSWLSAANLMRERGVVYEDLSGSVYAYNNNNLHDVASSLLKENLYVFNVSK